MSVDIIQGPDVVSSPLCQTVMRYGLTVRIAEFRMPQLTGRRSLAVVDRWERSNMWDDRSETNGNTFEPVLEEHGAPGLTRSVIRPKPELPAVGGLT